MAARKSAKRTILSAILPICAALLWFAGPAAAADLPLRPARPSAPPAAATPAPSSAQPLRAPDNACLEWTDGCRVCQRAPSGEVSCSNVGIACVPKAEQCTRQ
jgi:hypothetical protein